MKAIVVFHGHGTHWAARWLAPGYRHVFCAVESGDYWIMFDPRSDRPVIEVVAPAGYDLAAFYRSEGFNVIGIAIDGPAKPMRWPYLWANCVGAVKAVIGLRAPLVVTPYQLARRLRHDLHSARQDAVQPAQAQEPAASGTASYRGRSGRRGRAQEGA